MRTIKVVGSGPLSGKIFYGTHILDLQSPDCVILQLDECPFSDVHNLSLIPPLGFDCHVYFNAVSGMMEMKGSVETDLLRIADPYIGVFGERFCEMIEP